VTDSTSINTKTFIINCFDNHEIQYNADTIEKFMRFMEIVLDYNKDINLTAIKVEEDFIIKHFLDSLICCNWDMVLNAREIIDVGTGIGFPGVPLAILLTDKKFFLIDSLRKRLTVLNKVIKKIGLRNVELIHSRAEDLAHDKRFRESFDLCVSRAVADLKVLAELCIPFIKLDAYMIAYKGKNPDTEVKEARNAILTMGGRVEEVRTLQIEDYDRSIVVIKKENNTPARYPRKAGKPLKMPIC